MSDKRIAGPMAGECIEFSGGSLAEVFHVAADWFAANDDGDDGDIHILAVGLHRLDHEAPTFQYALAVAYDK